MEKIKTRVEYGKKPFKIKTERQINNFLKKRDFNKMAEMFKNCGWKWSNDNREPYSPTGEEIKAFALEMINSANTGKYECHYCGRIMIIVGSWGIDLLIGEYNP
ncbi:hypothetical protein [Emticicia fontis]